jgi:hypothetical protein
VNLKINLILRSVTATNLALAPDDKEISGPKNVSYDAQLCPIIAKSQRAPNAQLTCQIVDRHYEELKSCCADSQTLKNPF